MIRLLMALLLVVGAGTVHAECRPDRVDLRGDWGSARFTVEVADDFEEQRQGLMHRESLPMSHGMLFVYDRPRSATFWMKNTLIPLDMIFAGPDGVVRHIHENARPLDETSIHGGDGIRYVLEINGGLARQLGIAVGSELRHPALDAGAAAWACPVS